VAGPESRTAGIGLAGGLNDSEWMKASPGTPRHSVRIVERKRREYMQL